LYHLEFLFYMNLTDVSQYRDYYIYVPDQKLCNLMNSMLSNRYFKVYLNDDTSKWKRLNNGLPQGSVLAPLLFNLYISDVPLSSVKSKMFMYADDLAIAYQSKSFEEGQTILESDINILFDYYKSWRLKPNPTKTVVSAFHLNNAEANRSLIVNHNGIQLNFDPCPRYLGILLDRTLNFKEHLKSKSLKVRSRNNILQKLCGTNWGASAEVRGVATKRQSEARPQGPAMTAKTGGPIFSKFSIIFFC
jgi:hypothetical protein